MKPSQVYREAARLLERKEVITCCPAISTAERPYHDERGHNGECRLDQLEGPFREFFWPDNGQAYWWGSPKVKANQDARVIALCFMAAMAESGDL